MCIHFTPCSNHRNSSCAVVKEASGAWHYTTHTRYQEDRLRREEVGRQSWHEVGKRVWVCGCAGVCSQRGMKSEWKRWWRGFHMIGEPDRERIGCLGHGWSTGSRGRGRGTDTWSCPDSKAGKPWRGTFLGSKERRHTKNPYSWWSICETNMFLWHQNKYLNNKCEGICIIFSSIFPFQLPKVQNPSLSLQGWDITWNYLGFRQSLSYLLHTIGAHTFKHTHKEIYKKKNYNRLPLSDPSELVCMHTSGQEH